MVTITEIAEKAGVSPATVSRVLNGKVSVSEEKRRLVNHWIVKLGYKPNHVAQTLVGKQSFLLGVVVTDVSNPFFADTVRVLQQQAFLRGYSIVLCNTNAHMDVERQHVSSLLRRKVDGVLIVPSDPASPGLRSLRADRIPTVVITQQHPHFDSVSVDHAQGGAMVAAHLVSAGHTELVYFGKHGDSKFQGFQTEALARGLSASNVRCVEVEYSNFERSVADEHAREFFRSPEGKSVTAVFALNDFIAMSVINAAEDAGFRVPEDVSVVGFDNTYLSMMHRPAITSISQPIEEMGIRATDLLYRRMEDGDRPVESILLHPSVILRDSSSREVQNR